MLMTRAVRQLPRSARFACHTHSFLAVRSYASQAIAQQPHTPPPTSRSTSSPVNNPENDVPNKAVEPGKAARPQKTSDRELGDLISKMIPNRGIRPNRQQRPNNSTRPSSADEVAAELDRLSSNPIARRQGQLANSMNEGRSVDYDILEISQRASKLQPLNPAVRLDAYIGRSESVGRGTTLARAFDKLGMKLALNRVKYDIKKQRFHERPGLRRKRLKSERWRKQFKTAFVANIKKVQKMTKKGW